MQSLATSENLHADPICGTREFDAGNREITVNIVLIARGFE